ncbi:hypothetical protein ACTFIZ_002307 [Dictyostelium cf. discoideum]
MLKFNKNQVDLLFDNNFSIKSWEEVLDRFSFDTLKKVATDMKVPKTSRITSKFFRGIRPTKRLEDGEDEEDSSEGEASSLDEDADDESSQKSDDSEEMSEEDLEETDQPDHDSQDQDTSKKKEVSNHTRVKKSSTGNNNTTNNADSSLTMALKRVKNMLNLEENKDSIEILDNLANSFQDYKVLDAKEIKTLMQPIPKVSNLVCEPGVNQFAKSLSDSGKLQESTLHRYHTNLTHVMRLAALSTQLSFANLRDSIDDKVMKSMEMVFSVQKRLISSMLGTFINDRKTNTIKTMIQDKLNDSAIESIKISKKDKPQLFSISDIKEIQASNKVIKNLKTVVPKQQKKGRFNRFSSFRSYNHNRFRRNFNNNNLGNNRNYNNNFVNQFRNSRASKNSSNSNKPKE